MVYLRRPLIVHDRFIVTWRSRKPVELGEIIVRLLVVGRELEDLSELQFRVSSHPAIGKRAGKTQTGIGIAGSQLQHPFVDRDSLGEPIGIAKHIRQEEQCLHIVRIPGDYCLLLRDDVLIRVLKVLLIAFFIRSQSLQPA